MAVETPRSNGGLQTPGAVLLISCYELGHQPQGLALPMAFLEREGFSPSCVDLAVENLDLEKVRQSRFAAIAVPMHTALRLGIKAARRIREINPACHICFHGDYAILHAQSLLRGVADSVLGGELEARLVRLVRALENGGKNQLGRQRDKLAGSAILERLDFPVASRERLPAIERYAHLVHEEHHHVAGHVVASRGCLHHCRHCPIPAVYQGRIFVVPESTILADIRGQVAAGVKHITFGDADFLNGPSHSLRIVRAMHREFPDLTFDFTAKVEHLIERRSMMSELRSLGAIFVVSAIESLSDRVLSILEKGHSATDVFEATRILQDADIALRPSFLPFTPWSTFEDFVELLDFVEKQQLVEHVDPVQYSIRLLVPRGSLLIEHPEMQPLLCKFDEESLTYVWTHPDARMDTLQKQVARIVEEASANNEDPIDTFQRIRFLVGSEKQPTPPTRRKRQRPPRLTESWFC